MCLNGVLPITGHKPSCVIFFPFFSFKQMIEQNGWEISRTITWSTVTIVNYKPTRKSRVHSTLWWACWPQNEKLGPIFASMIPAWSGRGDCERFQDLPYMKTIIWVTFPLKDLTADNPSTTMWPKMPGTQEDFYLTKELKYSVGSRTRVNISKRW